MFDKDLKERIIKLEITLYKEIHDLKIIHSICSHCGITGHTKDMQIDQWAYGFFNYYHNGCYAEKFNKHLCPCKCGKWLDNKKTTIKVGKK